MKTKPAIQNIPLRTETGRALRDVFVSEEPATAMVDFAAIEARIAATLPPCKGCGSPFAFCDCGHGSA